MHFALPACPIRLRRTLAVALAALVSANAHAQTAPASGSATPAPTAAPAAHEPLSLIVQGGYEHVFSADVKNTSASMSTNRFALGAQHAMDWDADHLTVALGYAYINYDFSGVQSPFGNVQKIGANALYSHDFNQDWSAFAYVSAGFSAETAGTLGDGGQVAIAAGPTYKVNRVLTVSAGPMYYSRIEDEDTWTIYARVKWDFLPQWNLSAYAGVSNGATLTYDVFGNQATVVDASLDYNSRWFRLRDQPGAKSAVNESDASLKFGVRQALSENFFVRGYILYLFSREYQFHVNGNSASSFDVNSSWGLGFEVGAAF